MRGSDPLVRPSLPCKPRQRAPNNVVGGCCWAPIDRKELAPDLATTTDAPSHVIHHQLFMAAQLPLSGGWMSCPRRGRSSCAVAQWQQGQHKGDGCHSGDKGGVETVLRSRRCGFVRSPGSNCVIYELVRDGSLGLRRHCWRLSLNCSAVVAGLFECGPRQPLKPDLRQPWTM